MRSSLAAGALLLSLVTMAATPVNYYDVSVAITNQTQVGAWITVHAHAVANPVLDSFCVKPGHSVEKHYRAAASVSAEIKGSYDCSGAPRKRLAEELNGRQFRKTITGSGGSITW
jgi:hypothetical protein